MPSNQNLDYYYIIRETSPAESILIEYGFLDSAKDDRKQIKDDWKDWAEAVVKAVSEYKGYNYVEPNRNTVNNSYIVQKGDSLWSIAKRFNVGVNEIKSANNLSSNLINVGQTLIIPGVAPSNQTNVTYVVQKGDSLWSIANANNTTIDELVNLNDLVTNNIYVGQILKIPNSGESGVILPANSNEYVVQKGDTLYSIALKYNTTVPDLISKNNLNDTALKVGEVLQIPFDVESTGNNKDVIKTNTYIVQPGDSLYSISRKYGVSINDLINSNNLISDVLVIGSVLNIPTSDNTNDNNLYVVQKGDSLWSISRRFNTTVNDIRMMNNLKSDILTIGQSLIIP